MRIRVHIEEDAGKLIHEGAFFLLDFRCIVIDVESLLRRWLLNPNFLLPRGSRLFDDVA